MLPLEPPLQLTFAVFVILVIILGSVIITEEFEEQPFVSVTLIVYVPATKLGEIEPVEPLLHKQLVYIIEPFNILTCAIPVLSPLQKTLFNTVVLRLGTSLMVIFTTDSFTSLHK